MTVANINESNQWEDGLYQISRTDKVEGGRDGTANKQAQQLGSRTQWLKRQVESVRDYREHTFIRSDDDPDGTKAGLAGTNNGEIFRVIEAAGFTYYLNDNGLAKEQTTMAGMDAVRNIAPLNAAVKYSPVANGGKYEFAERFDKVSVDKDGNVLSFMIDKKQTTLVHQLFYSADFKNLLINGKEIDSAGILSKRDGDNITSLSQNVRFIPIADKFEFNPKVKVFVDEEFNILLDIEEYAIKKPLWDKAVIDSQNAKPQKVNPLLPYSEKGANGKYQIKCFNSETGNEKVVSAGDSNETDPRPENLDRIVWKSDRADSVPGGMFYAALPDLTPYPYVSRGTIVGWGHSFMENSRFLTRLCELTGMYGYNFGKSSMRSTGIAARQGGVPAYYEPEGGVIPASGTVNLTPNKSGPAATFTNSGLSVPPVFFCGVPGVFTWDGVQATFTRDEEGEPVKVTEQQPLYVRPVTMAGVTNGADKGVEYDGHDECINLFWLGRNNISQAERIAQDAIGMVNYMKNKVKRFVILPEFTSGGETAGTSAAGLVLAVNAELKKAFPDNYCEIDGVDLRQNFINHYNPDFDMDVQAFNNGINPPSLCYDWLHPSQSISNSNYPEHALYVGADINALFVYEFMKRKGWAI